MALVITIIVMLIIVGVAVGIALNEGGILKKSQEARAQQEEETIYEQLLETMKIDENGINLADTYDNIHIQFPTAIFNPDNVAELGENFTVTIPGKYGTYTFTVNVQGIKKSTLSDLEILRKEFIGKSINGEDPDAMEIITEICTRLGIDFSNPEMGRDDSGYYFLVSYNSGIYKVYVNMSSMVITDIAEHIADENGYFEVEVSNGDLTIIGLTDYGENAIQTNTDLTIPATITATNEKIYKVISIGDSAFNLISSLTSVIIENGVESIGICAFQECSNLESITIPGSVANIGGSAFQSCTKLTSATIENGVESIGSSAFQECSNLESITIPGSVTSIGDYAFDTDFTLTGITIYKTAEECSGFGENWNGGVTVTYNS